VATMDMVGLVEVCWRIIPLETPRVWRHCSKCAEVRPFYSSDQFRLNAQQRRIDVWLIYRCTTCDTTWNCTICTRSTPEAIGAELYQQFQHNDRDAAWQYAFDLALLHSLGARVDAEVRFRVERTPGACSNGHQQQITLALSYPCTVRLDRLLASELGVSRSSLQRRVDQGILHIWPHDSNALRKPIRDGQVITLMANIQPKDSKK
jgi:hypothetical protein